MSDHVERIDRKLLHAGTIIDMYTDTMRLPNGDIETWDFIKHRTGAAAILPILPDGKLLLVRQYRPALDRFALEVPAGARDSISEPSIDCAYRELEEETGYKCEHLTPLLKLRTTVAFCDESIDIFLAEHLTKGERHLDPAESIELCAYTLEEALSMIFDGTIQDSKTLSAILAYQTRLSSRAK
ncbi:MAG: NUDIX hydrolase [Lachnospiraceae bacterium]|nr:NUDIX hydrolase [Lachnospiraceae bacterium]